MDPRENIIQTSNRMSVHYQYQIEIGVGINSYTTYFRIDREYTHYGCKLFKESGSTCKRVHY